MDLLDGESSWLGPFGGGVVVVVGGVAGMAEGIMGQKEEGRRLDGRWISGGIINSRPRTLLSVFKMGI